MAKAVITIEDNETDGGVRLTLDLNPPVKTSDVTQYTDAQYLAAVVLDTLNKEMKEGSELEDLVEKTEE